MHRANDQMGGAATVAPPFYLPQGDECDIFAMAHARGLPLLQARGRGGDQTVFHFHMHVVPRHGNDGIALSWPRKEPGAQVLQGYAQQLRAALGV